MFGLSTKGDYGLSFLQELFHSGNSLVSLQTVAKERSLPLKYIERLAAKLKTAGIIVSKEGARGGYKLARDAKEISVLEVVEVLEGDLSLTPCTRHGADACPRALECTMRGPWLNIYSEVTSLLKNKSLFDLFNN